MFTKKKRPCKHYESCQTPMQDTSVCFNCGWLRDAHDLKISFKKRPKYTGLAAVGYSYQSLDIKANGKVVGVVNAPNWQTPDSKWGIRIAFMKHDIMSDGNPNCPWSWWKVGGRYDSEDAARQYVTDNLKQIVVDKCLEFHYLED